MRATIVPFDSVVTIDGVSFNDIDMTGIDPQVHAVQWYGTKGTVEYADPDTFEMLRNEPITSMAAFQSQLDQFAAMKAAADAEAQEAAEEQTVIEV